MQLRKRIGRCQRIGPFEQRQSDRRVTEPQPAQSQEAQRRRMLRVLLGEARKDRGSLGPGAGAVMLLTAPYRLACVNHSRKVQLSGGWVDVPLQW